VAAAADELGLDLHQTESVNLDSTVAAVQAAGAELAVVCAFGQLIQDPLLSELEMLNVHPSLVPRWRGAAPIERAIMAGDERTGVSILRVTAGLDSGAVALQEPLEIGEREDFGALSTRLAQLAAEVTVRALDLHEAGVLQFAEQDESQATYAQKISPDERRLDPGRSASELARTVRALNPHIGAYLELDRSQRLGVRAAIATLAEGPEPGCLAAIGGSLLLGCAHGRLRLDVVQPPGKRPMPADAYLRGHTVPPLSA
jgi:methionyl-tRNA formyltransferase